MQSQSMFGNTIKPSGLGTPQGTISQVSFTDTLDVTTQISKPTLSYQSGVGYIVLASDYDDPSNFVLSAGTGNGVQVVPGSALMSIQLVDQLTPGSTGSFTLLGSSISIGSMVSYSQVIGHETSLGLATYTADSTGFVITVSGVGPDTAAADLLNGSVKNVDFKVGSAALSTYGFGAGSAAPISFTANVTSIGVPEPGTWIMVLVVMLALTARRFRAIFSS